MSPGGRRSSSAHPSPCHAAGRESQTIRNAEQRYGRRTAVGAGSLDRSGRARAASSVVDRQLFPRPHCYRHGDASQTPRPKLGVISRRKWEGGIANRRMTGFPCGGARSDRGVAAHARAFMRRDGRPPAARTACGRGPQQSCPAPPLAHAKLPAFATTPPPSAAERRTRQWSRRSPVWLTGDRRLCCAPHHVPDVCRALPPAGERRYARWGPSPLAEATTSLALSRGGVSDA